MSGDTVTALGLMSGTSMDGIDAALIETDGERQVQAGPAVTVPYAPAFRRKLADAVASHHASAAFVAELTALHAEAVQALLVRAGLSAEDVAVVGFHGHTILHDPKGGRTVQVGDGEALASATGIRVVCDFRSADMAAGGQAAPLVPIYHFALSATERAPICVLNIGGVANVTWIGAGADAKSGDGIIAFDTGPGVALLDDWARRTTGADWDEDGKLAASGEVLSEALARLLDHEYFQARPPKSLDRNTFRASFFLEDCRPQDGAATLARFTAECVARACDFFPQQPTRWIACGGGRHNRHLMETLAATLGQPIVAAEAAGWDGDALEAQAFAYLAVRSLKGLPQTFPSTTGVKQPLAGGRAYSP